MAEATEAPHESKSWESDVELEASCPSADSPVEFLYDYLCPSPEACKAISYGMEDVLFTTQSDAEDFGPAADTLLSRCQKAWPSAAYTCYRKA